ncbi:diguanylate cyclase (GGDEF)-like protein [Sporomusaceae bacterium BoRhaA]|nr:diguanylate cyclase (GGDEF)-like protein [Pelorhabdus rhamnosifermentans]
MSKLTKKRCENIIGKNFCHVVRRLFSSEALHILDAYDQTKKNGMPQMICCHEHTTVYDLKEYFSWKFQLKSASIIVFIRDITEYTLLEQEFNELVEQQQKVTQELYAAMSNQDMYLMDMEQTKKHLAALYRITSVAQTTVNQQAVLDKIIENITNDFGTVNVALLLFDEVQQVLVVRAHTNCFHKFPLTAQISLSEGICGYAAQHREVVYIPNGKEDSQYIHSGGDCVSELAIPLVIKDKLLGVLEIETTDKREFYDMDIDMFRSIANQIAMTIDHANYVSKVQVQAITDGMTGLYNYRYFRTYLLQEFKRAKRYERPLAFLMMDIDWFKMYNDHYGHQKGDVVLRKIANLIHSAVRDVDIVVRYGGEEFAVILPETSIYDATVIAERIRKSVAEFPFENYETQPLGFLSVSIGIAGFPRDAMNDVEIIQHADSALYAAKDANRNCIRVFYQINEK